MPEYAKSHGCTQNVGFYLSERPAGACLNLHVRVLDQWWDASYEPQADRQCCLNELIHRSEEFPGGTVNISYIVEKVSTVSLWLVVPEIHCYMGGDPQYVETGA